MPMWNPWRGCHKYSEGCKYCYIHKGDSKRGVDTNEIVKTDNFYAPIEKKKNGEYKMKAGGTVYVCFSADFLIEEADEWRGECWQMIKERFDLHFIFLTKRIERFADCIPSDWGDSYENVTVFNPFPVEYKKEELKSMKETTNIFITITEKPARKVIIKRGKTAKDYFAYCEEVGCDVWGQLLSIKSINSEPVSMWLPKKHVKPNTSEYVQGAEVAADYTGAVYEGYDMIELPAAKYLMFQGEPFEEENYCEAIEALWDAIKKYNPQAIGFKWDDDNPRIQLEPRGERGYIELLAIK